MKKLAIVAVVAAFGFVSCKKDYTCTCKINGQTSTSAIEKAKKKDAEDACDQLETSAKIADPSATCSL